MNEKSSHEQILRSSAIIGGSSAFNILISLLRIKIVAVLLGPAGIGLISLLQNLMTTGSQISALGLGNAGTRQIAEAAGSNDQEKIDTARRALLWGTLLLSGIGGVALWLLRHVLAEQVLNDASLAPTVGWLGVGVAFSVASGSQSALLTGMRRIGDIARSQITSAFLSTLLGVGVITWLGEKGLVLYLISVPFVSFAVGHVFVARIPGVKTPRSSLSALGGQWKVMVRLGFAFMMAGLAGTLGQLVVRTLVQRDLGAESLGYFQAAWAISMTYLGFISGAMATDYYPRLTAVISNHERAIRLVNEQTEVALLLAGPVLLVLLGLVPWVIHLLYSAEFAPATSILRWQLLGDVLKVISWPMGFLIIAMGKGTLFMTKEAAVMAVFVLVTWLLLPYVQLEATGVAFLIMYAVNMPVLLILARMLIGFRWQRHIKWEATGLFACAVMVAAAGYYHDLAGAALGLVFALIVGARSLVKLASMAELGGPVGKLVGVIRRHVERCKRAES
jgi:PST family polysaccharide transporter